MTAQAPLCVEKALAGPGSTGYDDNGSGGAHCGALMPGDVKLEPALSYPSYLSLASSGELARRVEAAGRLLSPCRVCPLGCEADRLHDRPGDCGVGRRALVASWGPHYGEEPVLVGSGGSGTVFFAGCNLRCVFCQNFDISQLRRGRPLSPGELAKVFLDLQAQSCHNLNLVTPTHVVPQILEALALAVAAGFRLPLVYNTSSYDSLLALRLLDGVVDIYMPDIKYADAKVARLYSGVRSYPQVARRMILEMHRQVGALAVSADGLARRGLLLRHLVLPHGLAGSPAVLEFVARELSPDTYVNLMGQYRPAYRAGQHPELQRPLAAAEYLEALQCALDLGIRRGIPFDRLSHARTASEQGPASQ